MNSLLKYQTSDNIEIRNALKFLKLLILTLCCTCFALLINLVIGSIRCGSEINKLKEELASLRNEIHPRH